MQVSHNCPEVRIISKLNVPFHLPSFSLARRLNPLLAICRFTEVKQTIVKIRLAFLQQPEFAVRASMAVVPSFALLK